jgi:ribonuclease-3
LQYVNQKGKSLSLIQKDIGYFFNNEKLLMTALVHSSYAHENKESTVSHNERFEFLGDAVLSMIVCQYLMNKYPGYREGRLSAIKSYLVSEPVLAEVAREIKLGAYLLLGKGEEQTQGRNKNSLLANALEALIAAIYLDGGLEPVRLFVINQFSNQLAKTHRQHYLPDYKSLLQRYTQAKYNCRPKYELVAQEGPAHNRKFEVTLSVNCQVLAHGRGKSKKEAEVEAARKVVEGNTIRVANLRDLKHT